jgi:hypothetical protein
MTRIMTYCLVLGALMSQAVNAAALDPRCEKLVPHASVKMDFTEPAVKELTTQSKEEVKRLAKKSQFPNQTVYGLTRGKPEVQYEVNRARINLRGGKVCIVPRVTVKAGFSDMTVYLAHELLKSPCKLNLIRAHEMEHVNTWRTHLKGGISLMQKPLQAKFSVPRLYDSAQAADADLRNWIIGTIDPMMQQLFQNITKAQMEIDSPMSYQLVLEELKACPI